MYGSRIDAAQGIVIGLFWGDANSDDDYQRYVDSLVDADRSSPPEIPKTVVLVVDRGNPAPPAQWRKRIADATERIRSKDVLFVLCAESPLIRGVVTAINWIRPPRYDVQVVPSPAAMLAVLAQRRGNAEELVRQMLAELRVASRRSTPPL